MKAALRHLLRRSAAVLMLAAPLLLPAPASAEYGEMFGLRLGMSRQKVRGLGVKLEPSGVSAAWGERWRAEELPKPPGDERWVWLYFGNGDRLFRIVAQLADRGLAYDARDALKRYRQLKNHLAARFALTASREPTHPEGEPCFNPAGTATNGSSVIDASARDSYETALKIGGPHKFISMMHFCTIQKWSATFGESDTTVTVTISPKDARKFTSYAFIHIKVGSKSLQKKFRRAKSPL